MRTATLIVNPAAGRAALLKAHMAPIAALLAQHGYAADFVETSAAAGSGEALARNAAQHAARHAAKHAGQHDALVLACGGDGTVHAVVQGLAQTGVPLGIVPLGTANALARNLKLPLHPLAAIARLMSYTARAVPLGQVQAAGQTRWFCLMAGCGPAGALVHTMAQGSKLKARFGRAAYYAHAARLFLTRRWPVFHVEYRTSAGECRSVPAVAIMASWVPDLGGLFSGVTFQPSPMNQRLHVQIVRGPAWLSLPAWMLLGGHASWVQQAQVEELSCMPLDQRAVYVQADAEPMGSLPFHLRVVPAALQLLMPPTST